MQFETQKLQTKRLQARSSQISQSICSNCNFQNQTKVFYVKPRNLNNYQITPEGSLGPYCSHLFSDFLLMILWCIQLYNPLGVNFLICNRKRDSSICLSTRVLLLYPCGNSSFIATSCHKNWIRYNWRGLSKSRPLPSSIDFLICTFLYLERIKWKIRFVIVAQYFK